MQGPFRPLRKLLALPPPQRREVLMAALLLPPFRLGLRLLGLRRWRKLTVGRLGTVPAAADLAQAQSAGDMVNLVAGFGPWRTNCLARSVLLEWMLRRRGVRVALRIGVRREADALQAHAWVESDGVPVNDEPDIAERFAPFADLPPASAFRAA